MGKGRTLHGRTYYQPRKSSYGAYPQAGRIPFPPVMNTGSYPLYPLGFPDCHFQEEAHISSEFLGDGVKLLEEAVRWGAALTAVVYTPGTALPALPAWSRSRVQLQAGRRNRAPMELRTVL